MARVGAHATASIAACYFFFFAMVALQGVLLNVLPARTFARVSGTAQGLCAATMLILIVLSFSIGATGHRLAGTVGRAAAVAAAASGF